VGAGWVLAPKDEAKGGGLGESAQELLASTILEKPSC